MVVEPAEDFGVGAVSEAVVGEVGLPGLVGEVGFEADVGRFGAFGRFGGDELGAAHDPVDRCSGEFDVVVLLEVPGDGVGPGIETGGGEAAA